MEMGSFELRWFLPSSSEDLLETNKTPPTLSVIRSAWNQLLSQAFRGFLWGGGERDFFFNFSEQGWGDFWQMALGKEAETWQNGRNGIETGRRQWCHESWSRSPSSHSEVFAGQNAQCASRSGGCWRGWREWLLLSTYPEIKMILCVCWSHKVC